MTAEILDELEWRGLIAHSTQLSALGDELASGSVTFYCGFDPTAPSLQFGNLLQLVTMRRLQLVGHSPIAVVGGATGLIGDPSGRTIERTLNDAEVVADWVTRIQAQIERLLDFSGPNAAQIVNNLEWTAPLSTLEFLRDVGKHFSLNRMLDKESVSARLQGPGISFTEFSYQVLQALDYLELFRRYGCRLQTGGSDQWGNLTAGVDLIRRVTGATVHALVTPLITKADGTKYGATAGGALWLDPELTSPYTFYQYFLNTDDADIVALLKVFSFRSRQEIESLGAEVAARPESRAAQQALATELTGLVHGIEAAIHAASASAALFGSGELAELDAETLASALAELPRAEINDAPRTIGELLVATGLSESRTAARRTVAEGGAYLNNRRVADPELVPGDGDLLHGRWLVLRRGKRSLAAVEKVS
jgi:tyrosyl-tRNA synthetase